MEPLSGGARRDAYRVVDDTGDRFVLRLDRDAASLRKEVALTELVHDRVPVVAVVGADLAGGLVGLPLTLGLRRGESLDVALAGAGGDDVAMLGIVVGRTLAPSARSPSTDQGSWARPCSPSRWNPCPSSSCRWENRCWGTDRSRRTPGVTVTHGYLGLLWEAAPSLKPVATQANLVHSDFNAKNLVIAREFDGTPSVGAVLDWEFSFAGPPLADVGNMLRRQERMPRRSSTPSSGGSPRPARATGWRSIAATLDALALLDFLDRGARGRHGEMYTEACSLIEEAVARGDLAPPAAT